MRPLQSCIASSLPRCFSGKREEGSALIELALLLPVFLLLFVGMVDFGRGFFAAIEVTSAAEAAATYGSQQPTDTSGIQAAAVMAAGDLNNVTSTVATGCQCADGTSVDPGCNTPPTNCASNVVSYVQVTTNAPYIPLFKYPGLPSIITLQSTAQMRSAY
jgi:Flp pilus assembly protein TadG